MTPEKQRIAIAEACGWYAVKGIGWSHPSLPPAANIYGLVPPDYLNDLNAMHEAEKVLTREQRGLYLCISYDIVIGVPPDSDPCNPSYWAVPTEQAYEQITMTAAQRAEAFLRTIGKWEEAP